MVVAGKGYYLNAGSDDEKVVIKCDGSNCEAIEPEDNCAIGKVIKEGTSIKLCITDDNKGEIAVATGADAIPTYETLKVAADAFPGVTIEDGKNDKKIAVKLKTDGSALLLEPASLPGCVASPESSTDKCKISDDEVVDYCILEEKIYKSDTNACALLTNDNVGTTIFFFKDDGSAVDVTATTPDTPNMAYKCTFDKASESEPVALTKCELVKGYVKINDDFYQCNGWKGEECQKITLTNCSNDANGLLGNFNSKKSICFSENSGVSLPTANESTPSLLAFTLSSTSSKYGMMMDDVVTLSLSSTEALVTTLDSGKYLFYIR